MKRNSDFSYSALIHMHDSNLLYACKMKKRDTQTVLINYQNFDNHISGILQLSSIGISITLSYEAILGVDLV